MLDKRLITTMELIDSLYPEQTHPDYGTKEEVKQGIVEFFAAAKKRMVEIAHLIKTHKVLVGWAGIGDAVYSRLVIQHLALDEDLTWIAPPFVAPLYKDDSLCTIIPGFSSPYRDVRRQWISRGLSAALHELCEQYLSKHHVVYISRAASRYWRHWAQKPTTYADLFLNAIGLTRDPSVICTLTHHGVPTIELPEQFIVLERCSITFGAAPIEPYVKLVNAMKARNIGVVIVGAPDEPLLDGCVDARGMDLYDTFSIVKRAMGFVGMSSGNEALTAFLPELKLFEVEIPAAASFAVAMRPRNYYRVSLANLASDVARHI